MAYITPHKVGGGRGSSGGGTKHNTPTAYKVGGP